MHLGHIMRLAAARFPWTKKTYRALEWRTADDDVRAFKRRHLMGHLSTALGSLAESEEHFDHGHPHPAEDKARITETIGKIVMDVLYFAATQGVEAHAVESWILQKCAMPTPRPLTCREWSGACGGTVEPYMRDDRKGIETLCAYHASVDPNVMKDNGRPVTLAHYDATYVDQTDSG